MFNRQAQAAPRTDLRRPQPNLEVVPPPLPSSAEAHPVGPAATSPLRHTSIIGHDLTIIGERLTIITQGTLQLDGEVQGDLHGTEIIIGENGRVSGTVSAERVAVHGQVSGVIRGLKVELLASSRVDGEIHNRTLTIAEGAQFDGRVRRPTDAAELQPVLDPARHAPTESAPHAA